jgi:hypothetical protein
MLTLNDHVNDLLNSEKSFSYGISSYLWMIFLLNAIFSPLDDHSTCGRSSHL